MGTKVNVLGTSGYGVSKFAKISFFLGLTRSIKMKIAQALLQAAEGHKSGQLQYADRLYRAILESEPMHADANHNFGFLALLTGRSEVALSLLKVALESNPKVDQDWLSYIDALIRGGETEPARSVIKLAKKQGVNQKKSPFLRLRSNGKSDMITT